MVIEEVLEINRKRGFPPFSQTTSTRKVRRSSVFRSDDMKTTQIQIKKVSTEIHTTDKQHKKDILRVWAGELVNSRSLFYNNAWGNSEAILNFAKSYAVDKKRRSVVLYNKETSELLKLPYATRFSEEYAAKQTRRVMRGVKFDSCAFLTLTIDPKRFASLAIAYSGIRKSWHRLSSAFLIATKRGSNKIRGWSGKYFLVVEMQENGSPHLHVLLHGCSYLDYDWVRELWSDMGIMIKVEYVRSNRGRVVSYILKYASKAISADGVPNLTSALLWALSARAFSGTSARKSRVGVFFLEGKELRTSGYKGQKGILDSAVRLTATETGSVWVFKGVWDTSECSGWFVLSDIQEVGVDYG